MSWEIKACEIENKAFINFFTLYTIKYFFNFSIVSFNWHAIIRFCVLKDYLLICTCIYVTTTIISEKSDVYFYVWFLKSLRSLQSVNYLSSKGIMHWPDSYPQPTMYKSSYELHINTIIIRYFEYILWQGDVKWEK